MQRPDAIPEADAQLHEADVETALAKLPEGHFSAALCDPPYGLGMFGLHWDQEVPSATAWAALARTLEPGAWLLAFGHPKTFHRLMVAIEEAGFELRDTLGWFFGTGFPKGPNGLRPAWQPIVLAKRPGAPRPLGIEGCRTQGVVLPSDRRTSPRGRRRFDGGLGKRRDGPRHHEAGRWPTNLLFSHGPECDPECNEAGCAPGCPIELLGGERGVPRFFYCAKPAGREIENNPHPTKKPVRLTTYLARMLRPADGARLVNPYCGSGSELVGALRAGWRRVVGIDFDATSLETARMRVDRAIARISGHAS